MSGDTSIGVIRADLLAGASTARISIHLDPAVSRKGHGTAALRQFDFEVRGRWSSIESVNAQIHKANVASLKAFDKAGYVPQCETGEFTILKKDLPLWQA